MFFNLMFKKIEWWVIKDLKVVFMSLNNPIGRSMIRANNISYLFSVNLQTQGSIKSIGRIFLDSNTNTGIP